MKSRRVYHLAQFQSRLVRSLNMITALPNTLPRKRDLLCAETVMHGLFCFPPWSTLQCTLEL